MPIGRSAKKSLRKSLKLRKSNNIFKTKLKETVKGFLAKPTEKTFVAAQSMLDKAKKEKVWHINKISRIKSQMAKKLVLKSESKEVAVKKKPVKKTTKKVAVKRTAKEKMSK